MSDTAHIPAQNLDAEESVLGAMMLSPSAIVAVAEVLEQQHFYRPSHGAIFHAATELNARGDAVDAITLSNALEVNGTLEQAGGRERIHELAMLVPAAANAPHYARIVREMAGLRDLGRAGAEIQRLVQERAGSVDEIAEQAEQALSQAIKPTFQTQFSPLSDDLSGVTDEILAAYESGVPLMGLKTGYIDLDNILTGLHPGTLTYVAARPGMGKSALGLNIGENVADNREHAAILTLEMSRRELLMRSLSRACRIDSVALRTGKLKPEEAERLRQGQQLVRERIQFLHIEDSPAVTPTALRAEVRRLASRHDLKLLIVDYVQLMLASSNDDNRQAEIAAISRSLKLLAKELEIPVVALSQLNRNLEARAEKRPALSDLRDSGALEQDADVVLFIYRDEYYNPDSNAQGIAELIVAKNRMGPSQTVKLAFTARYSTFNNLAKGTP